ALADTYLANLLETRQIAAWRLQAVVVTELDSNQAETSQQQALAAHAQLLMAVQQSRYALAALAGQTPDTLVKVLTPDGAVPARMDDPALPLPAVALRQRPDVLAAAETVQAAHARLAQAQAAQGTGFKLGSSVGLQSLTLASLADPVSFVRTVLGNASVTLWDGGAGAAQVEVQHAALLLAQSAHRTLARSVVQDVEKLLVALSGQREQLLAQTMAANTARTAAALASQRYNTGLVDYQVVLEAQRTLLSAQDSEAIALADVGATQVRLYAALGGGWRADSSAVGALVEGTCESCVPVYRASPCVGPRRWDQSRHYGVSSPVFPI
ncbi:MAG: TolC family protein, partial [Rhodoferax sp.]